MKKWMVLLCAGVMAASLTGCGDKGGQNGGSTGGSTAGSQGSVEQSSEEVVQPSVDEEPAGGEENPGQEIGTVVNGHDYAEGWTESMQAVRDAVADEFGEAYWPNMPLTPDMFEMSFGISPDLYDDYIAEVPMMSAHVDSLIVVKAKEGREADVLEALNAYRNNNVNNLMQYPMNVGKVQASAVEQIGSYICFVQLGGDTAEIENDEEVIALCKEANDKAIGLIKAKVE